MKLFLVKEIISKEGELHFRRWRIISTPWFSIYVHGIYKADEEAHMHDHPWNYTSITLSGYFSEKTIKPYGAMIQFIKPFTRISRKAESLHKIQTLHSKSVFTLFFTGRRRREWGYDVNGKWIDNVTYRKLKNENKLT